MCRIGRTRLSYINSRKLKFPREKLSETLTHSDTINQRSFCRAEHSPLIRIMSRGSFYVGVSIEDRKIFVESNRYTIHSFRMLLWTTQFNWILNWIMKKDGNKGFDDIITSSNNVMRCALEINFHFNWFQLKSIFGIPIPHFILNFDILCRGSSSITGSRQCDQINWKSTHSRLAYTKRNNLLDCSHWQHRMTLWFDEPIPHDSWPIRQSNCEFENFRMVSSAEWETETKIPAGERHQHHLLGIHWFVHSQSTRECQFNLASNISGPGQFDFAIFYALNYR